MTGDFRENKLTLCVELSPKVIFLFLSWMHFKTFMSRNNTAFVLLLCVIWISFLFLGVISQLFLPWQAHNLKIKKYEYFIFALPLFWHIEYQESFLGSESVCSSKQCLFKSVRSFLHEVNSITFLTVTGLYFKVCFVYVQTDWQPVDTPDTVLIVPLQCVPLSSAPFKNALTQVLLTGFENVTRVPASENKWFRGVALFCCRRLYTSSQCLISKWYFFTGFQKQVKID